MAAINFLCELVTKLSVQFSNEEKYKHTWNNYNFNWNTKYSWLICGVLMILPPKYLFTQVITHNEIN